MKHKNSRNNLNIHRKKNGQTIESINKRKGKSWHIYIIIAVKMNELNYIDLRE